ncbi:MAG: DUF3737 family protein [Ruminococcus sp.]|nr:DUF3737 family protein [Ruminococcus sp.]
MKEIYSGIFTGERAEFAVRDRIYRDSIFCGGESPLKHSSGIELKNSMFKWKYPLWYSRDIQVEDCAVFEMGRAGIWYTENIRMVNTVYEAPKGFRRCTGVSLEKVDFPNAQETLWDCGGVSLRNVTAKGDYFGMNCRDVEVNGLILTGNYCFDGCRNVAVKNSKLLSKDAFWNCENVLVEDSFISGEYLAWNSEHVTFVNCVIESLQGLCFVKDLTLERCRLLNTTLAFEYSTVNADIVGSIDSVKNPAGGRISCEDIGELIMESDRVDCSETVIEYRGVNGSEV